MRRVEPAYPDLVPITHVVRPGYLPGPKVALDPIRMSIVWKEAPQRILPATDSLPRDPVRAILFSHVARKRPDILHNALAKGSSLLLVLDEPQTSPDDLGLDPQGDGIRLTPLLPVLPSALGNGLEIPTPWTGYNWGAIIGLFPFPGADSEVEDQICRLHEGGADFVVAAPLLLTPKDRHKILDACDGAGIEDRMENALFHADVSRGLHAIERRAGIVVRSTGLHPYIPNVVPKGAHPAAVQTAARLRLWARRLDQSREESSWGWRLRRAASALEPLNKDPETLANEDNLRVVPGFDPWVESFTKALWEGGDPVDAAWKRWSGLKDGGPNHPKT